MSVTLVLGTQYYCLLIELPHSYLAVDCVQLLAENSLRAGTIFHHPQ